MTSPTSKQRACCERTALSIEGGLDRLRDENTRLRGAMAADDERLRKAAERVGIVSGCDAPEWMAEEIERLRTLLRSAWHALDAGEFSQLRDRIEPALKGLPVETSVVSAEDVRSLRLQWAMSCSPDHDDCPSCQAFDRALMRLAGNSLDSAQKTETPQCTCRFSSDDRSASWTFDVNCKIHGYQILKNSIRKTEACPVHSQPGHPFADCTCRAVKTPCDPEDHLYSAAAGSAIGAARVFADADNNGRDARILTPPLKAPAPQIIPGWECECGELMPPEHENCTECLKDWPRLKAPTPLGFGIPILMEDARALMDKGIPMDTAIEMVANRCELRSEAISALRDALKASGDANV